MKPGDALAVADKLWHVPACDSVNSPSCPCVHRLELIWSTQHLKSSWRVLYNLVVFPPWPFYCNNHGPPYTACTFLQFSARTFYAGKSLGYEWLERWNVRSRVIRMWVPWYILFVFLMVLVTRSLQRTPNDSFLEALTYWHIDTSTTNLRLKSGIKNEDRKQIRGAVGLVKIRLPRKCDKKKESNKCMLFGCLHHPFLYIVKEGAVMIYESDWKPGLIDVDSA